MKPRIHEKKNFFLPIINEKTRGSLVENLKSQQYFKQKRQCPLKHSATIPILSAKGE